MPIVFPPPVASSSSASTGDMELIFSTTLTSKATTISTGTLPTGYRALVVRGQVRSDAAFNAVGVFVAFNGDTTDANYSYVRDFSTTTQTSFQSNNSGQERIVALAAGANATASTFGVFTVTIHNHESTSNLKSYNSVTGTVSKTASMQTNRITGKRLSTDAITAIAFSADVGDFEVGTAIAVYGVK